MTHHTLIPASFLIVKQKNKILLLRRFNTGYQDGNYTFIAGHVEPNETFTQAIIREAKEEANITITSNNIKLTHMMHRKSDKDAQERIDAFFITENWQGEIKNMEPNKCDHLEWFDINNLPTNTVPFLKEVLKHIKNNEHYSEFGW